MGILKKSITPITEEYWVGGKGHSAEARICAKAEYIKIKMKRHRNDGKGRTAQEMCWTQMV